MTKITTSHTCLRKQNKEVVDQQQEMISKVINTLYVVFSDFKDEVKTLRNPPSDEKQSMTQEFPPIFIDQDGGSWM